MARPRNKLLAKVRSTKLPYFSKAVNTGLWALLQAGVPPKVKFPAQREDVRAALRYLSHLVDEPTGPTRWRGRARTAPPDDGGLGDQLPGLRALHAAMDTDARRAEDARRLAELGVPPATPQTTTIG